MRNNQQKEISLRRSIVTMLRLTVVVSVAGPIALEMTHESTSEILVALGWAALGGLIVFLVPFHLYR